MGPAKSTWTLDHSCSGYVQRESIICGGFFCASSAALRPVEKLAHNWIEPSAFFTTTMGAAHFEYVTDVMTFLSSRCFSSLSSGSAVYGIARLGWNTGLVEGLSVSVASTWLQHPRLLVKTGENRLSISSVRSLMALWISDFDTALQTKLSGMSRRPSGSVRKSPKNCTGNSKCIWSQMLSSQS